MAYPSNWWQSTFNPAKSEYNLNSALLQKEQNFNAEQAQITRDFNAEQAKLQRDFEERMSNTAYQRAFNDIKSAGLNPYIMYTQGGADTPSGATAQASATQSTSKRVNVESQLKDFLKFAGGVVTTAMKVALML